MAKGLFIIAIILLHQLAGCDYIPDNSVSSVTVLPDAISQNATIETKEDAPVTVIPGKTDNRQKVREIYQSQLGVREATGHNDGRDVAMYLRSTGIKFPAAWCSAFVRWVFDSAHVKTTITAWSPTAENKRDIIYKNGTFAREPLPGDIFCLYFSSLGRIGHTGFYDGRLNDRVYKTIEGNTNDAGSREGDGVYIKYRSFRATYSISNWIKNE